MGSDTSRKQVKTYVPAYQKDEWKRHADELDMSQSEFVRTMVQAGRRGFGETTPDEDRDEASRTGDGAGAAQSSDDLADDVVAALADAGPLSWDELLATVTDDVERRLDETLERLQRDGEVRYSGREDGYVLVEE